MYVIRNQLAVPSETHEERGINEEDKNQTWWLLKRRLGWWLQTWHLNT